MRPIDRRPRKTERRHGLADSDRILSSVRFRSKTGCWEWQKSLVDGYGRLRVRRKLVLAHRFAFQTFIGPVPDNSMVCHTCDNPRCCNPWHLFIGDNSSNQQDRVCKGRWSAPVDLRGEHHPRAKLSAHAVSSIRLRASAGESQKALGVEFGISQSMVSLIVRRKKWSHVA